MKTVFLDSELRFCVSLTQHEIFLLLSGVVPYIIFSSDPNLPPGDKLWIHHQDQLSDFFPTLEPFPCTLLSIVCLNDSFIVTVQPTLNNAEFIQLVDEYKTIFIQTCDLYKTSANLPNFSFHQ